VVLPQVILGLMASRAAMAVMVAQAERVVQQALAAGRLVRPVPRVLMVMAAMVVQQAAEVMVVLVLPELRV
jgi:hypothetical protein